MASEIYLAEDGQQIGPLPEQEVRRRIERGEVTESTYAWIEGAADWKPIVELLPELFAMTIAVSASSLAQATPSAAAPAVEPAPPAEPAPPVQEAAPVPERPSATSFDVALADDLRQPRLTLENAAVIIESTALHYTRGEIATEPLVDPSGAPEGTRSVCRGSGTVCLAPTAAECSVMDLGGEEWILDEGAFLACDHGLAVETVAAGEGLMQTRVSGQGKLLLRAQGPVERVQLEDETLVVCGTFAVARTGALTLSVQRTGRSLTRKLHGTGTVLLAPMPYRSLAQAPAPKNA